MRNWSAILIDAGLRGLSQAELAREIGAPHQEVGSACKRYGVRLADGYAKRRENDKAMTRQRHAEMFRDTPPGLTINAFCRLHQVSQGFAEYWSARHGYRFVRPKRKNRGSWEGYRDPRFENTP